MHKPVFSCWFANFETNSYSQALITEIPNGMHRQLNKKVASFCSYVYVNIYL